MSRTTVTPSVFVPNSTTSLADPAGTTINSGLVTAGVNVPLASEAIPAANRGARGLVLRVAATSGSTKNLTIRAGANPPAFRADIGDLVVPCADSTTTWVGPFDPAIYSQSDDSINVDFATGFTGTISAFVMPREI